MSDPTTPNLFDPQVLLSLLQRPDPIGVLSIYVDADRRVDPTMAGAAIDIKNRLRELERRLRDDSSPGRRSDLVESIDRLGPEIERLTSPEEFGRSRAFFAALGDEQVVHFASQLHVSTRVVFDSTAFIHPLLELLEEGLPAGVIVVSRDEAKILEWRLGELTLLDRMAPDMVEASHERSGPVGPTPTARQGTPMREQRTAREREQSSRFLGQVAAVTSTTAGERGWTRILVSGDERLTEAFLALLAPPLRDVAIVDPRLLLQSDADSLSAAVTDRLHTARDEFESQLIRRAGGESGGSGQVALGLSEVVGALNEGRVAHLIYDPAIRYQGSMSVDGRLHAGDEAGPSGTTSVLEPRLTERLVERALETRARITPLAAKATVDLRSLGGIAGLLRW